MTHTEAMRYRLTPDFTMRPLRMPTAAEYKLSMEILRDFHSGRSGLWHGGRRGELSDMEHEVLMALYGAGIIAQNKYTLDRALTKYGEVYFFQREDSSKARDLRKPAARRPRRASARKASRRR